MTWRRIIAVTAVVVPLRHPRRGGRGPRRRRGRVRWVAVAEGSVLRKDASISPRVSRRVPSLSPLRAESDRDARRTLPSCELLLPALHRPLKLSRGARLGPNGF